jgi:hypothetical protein
MDSLIARLDAAKQLMAAAEKLFDTDCEESTIVAKAAEAILKKVNQAFSDINNKRSISVIDYEQLLAGTEPADDETSTVAASRRNFAQWAKTLNLQTGHLLYFGDVPFRLAYSKARATLTTQTHSGKIIVGYSPSGAIKAYLKAIGSLQTNVDGWKRMTMVLASPGPRAQAYKEDYKPIGWHDWLLLIWDANTKAFV